MTLEEKVGQLTLVPSRRGKASALVEEAKAGRIGARNLAADALIFLGHAGLEAGPALGRLLFGAAEPGGRLAFSVPRHAGQCPIHSGMLRYGRPRLGIGVWRDVPNDPLYPFGHGLGYTTFEIEEPRLSAAAVRVGERAVVWARVRNTGARAGTAVVQLYLQGVAASRLRPERELRDFRRFELPPGGCAEVEFALGPEALGYYGPEGAWTVEPGLFRLGLGLDSRAPLDLELELLR